MKYYAVAIGRRPGVYTNWEECNKQIQGFSGNLFKKFNTLRDAKLFIQNKKPAAITENIINTSQTVVGNTDADTAYAYIDGSYNIKTGCYGYGGFINVNGAQHTVQGYSNNPEQAKMRNVAGELAGAIAIVKKAIELHIPRLILYYDYKGIEAWATGEWKTKNIYTKTYHDFMDKASQRATIIFVKVAAHTGATGNTRADKLAKQAVGIKK